MHAYSAVAPQMLEEPREPAFIGGVIIGRESQSEIPIHFNNKNRRRLFWVVLILGGVIAILTVSLLIYAFAVAH